MNRAEDIRAKAKRIGGSAPTPPPARPADPPNTKRVRITTDLSPVDHAALKRWCFDTAEQLGRPGVPGQQVIEALVARLLHDPALAEQVRDDLRARSA